jgi:prophage regulatory protein
MKQNTNNTLPTNGVRILRMAEAIKRTGLCRSLVYSKMADGSFPQKIDLSTRSIGFLESEVDSWILARVAERDAVAAAKGLQS